MQIPLARTRLRHGSRALRERWGTTGSNGDDEFGLPAVYKEAVECASMAFAAKRGLANTIPAAGGAESFAVLGKLSMAP